MNQHSLGGHVRPDLYGHIPTYIERHGLEAGAELAKFELAHLKALKEVISKEGIDCDLNITRNMNVYLNDAAGEKAKQAYEALAAQGLSFVDNIHYTPENHAEEVRRPFSCTYCEADCNRCPVSKVLKPACPIHQAVYGLTNSFLVCFRRSWTPALSMSKQTLQ